MKSYSTTVYTLEKGDLVTTTKFEDGSVSAFIPGYMSTDNRGFRIDFLPEHIPALQSLITLLGEDEAAADTDASPQRLQGA